MPSRKTADHVGKWGEELERLSNILGQIGPDELCCDGLSQRQTAILRVLVASEGARLTDLAALSGITPSAMTRVLEKLEARGLVERVRGAHDDGRAAMVRVRVRVAVPERLSISSCAGARKRLWKLFHNRIALRFSMPCNS